MFLGRGRLRRLRCRLTAIENPAHGHVTVITVTTSQTASNCTLPDDLPRVYVELDLPDCEEVSVDCYVEGPKTSLSMSSKIDSTFAGIERCRRQPRTSQASHER